MQDNWRELKFRDFLRPNLRPYLLGPTEDANLVGMRLYGGGPFHRELKSGLRIAKKSHFTIRAGDIIYNKLFAWKGAFGIVPASLDGMLVSDKFPTYDLDRSQVNESWLMWYFRYPAVWEEARLLSKGSAALSKLTLNPPKFLQLTMPVPPPSVQMEIIARLEAVALKVTEAQELRRETERESKAVFHATLDQICRICPPDGELKDVLSSPPRNGWSASCDNADGGTPVLSLGAVTGFRYRRTEFKRTSLYANADGHFWLNAGDLLITRSNTPELVGHAAIYDGHPTPCIYPDLIMRLAVNQNSVNTRFVWYWLQTSIARQHIQKRAKGTSPTMKKISQSVVSSIPFPSSLSISRQFEIVKELDELQGRVDSLRTVQHESAAELDALIPSTIAMAFSGKL